MTNAFSIDLSFAFTQKKETNTIVSIQFTSIQFISIQSILILSSSKCALLMNESSNKKSRQKKKNEQFDWMIRIIHHFFIINTIDFNYIKITYQRDCVILLLLIKKFAQKIELFTTFWLNKIIDVKINATTSIYRLLSNNKKTTYRRKAEKILSNFIFFFLFNEVDFDRWYFRFVDEFIDFINFLNVKNIKKSIVFVFCENSLI